MTTTSAEDDVATAVSAAVAARARHMLGPVAADELTDDAAMAWEGMLETSRHMRRMADDLLTREHDLSVSMLGTLGRLAIACDRTMRQTELARAMGLSISRVSRVVDLLEVRGLVTRRTCPSDARATNVTLTKPGIALTTVAQERLHALVRAAFVERLGADEMHVLATVFRRLIDAPS